MPETLMRVVSLSGKITPAVSFRNVSFSYDGVRKALDGITFDVPCGQFVCILGGNGSGKSTLAKHINALLLPDEGEVFTCGRSTADAESTFFVRSSAGMVFQNPADQIVASVVEDDVAFGPENLGIPVPELRKRVNDALAQVGLQGFQRRETLALSGGQKQRVAIAGALAMRPRILVFDESAAMLDPRGRAGLMKECARLNAAGMTVVFITHHMDDAALADRVIVLDGGRVALDGSPDAVFEQAARLKALSLDVSFSVQMSLELRNAGLDVPVCATEEALVGELEAMLS